MSYQATGAQRLPPLVTSATSDGAGNATFTFAPVPSTRERWGTLICPRAPVGAVFMFEISGSLVFSWAGPNAGGPVIVVAMATPTIIATGLNPGTVYALVWHGYEGPAGSAELSEQGGVYPGAGNVTQPLVTLPPSGPGLLAWAIYSTSVVGVNPITWAEGTPNSGFAYLGTGTELTAVPADSITRVILSLIIGDQIPGGNPFQANIQMVDSVPATIDEVDFYLNSTTIFDVGAQKPNTELWVDAASPPGAGFPYTWEGSVTNLSPVGARLQFASWAKP